jgi:hypothetical protein
MKTFNLNRLFSLFTALAISSLVVSCDQEDNTGFSTLVPSNASATITFETQPPSTMEEADLEFPFVITLSEAQNVDIVVNLFQAGGDATEGDDFELSAHSITIPAFTTQASGYIKTIFDTEKEEDETVVIQIGDETSANVTLEPIQISFTLQNSVSDNLDITFDWDRDVDWGGTLYPTGSNIDLDIFVADGEGYDNNDPWATVNWTDYAATGDHPEVLSMNIDEWGDGEYILFHDLWANGFYGLDTDTQVPITATFVRAGSFSTVVVQDDSQAINTDTPGAEEGGAHSGFIAKVTIANGQFIITDFNDVELASGKSSNTKRTPRPLSIRK